MRSVENQGKSLTDEEIREFYLGFQVALQRHFAANKTQSPEDTMTKVSMCHAQLAQKIVERERAITAEFERRMRQKLEGIANQDNEALTYFYFDLVKFRCDGSIGGTAYMYLLRQILEKITVTDRAHQPLLFMVNTALLSLIPPTQLVNDRTLDQHYPGVL